MAGPLAPRFEPQQRTLSEFTPPQQVMQSSQTAVSECPDACSVCCAMAKSFFISAMSWLATWSTSKILPTCLIAQ